MTSTITDDVTAPAGWILNRSLIGTPDERLILIRDRDTDVRYELYWAGQKLHIDVTRWCSDDAVAYGRFLYTAGRIRITAGTPDAISVEDRGPVLAVAAREWALSSAGREGVA